MIKDVFGIDSKPYDVNDYGSNNHNVGVPTDIKVDDSYKECKFYAEDGYRCVPYYSCENGEIIIDGAGLLNPRFGGLNDVELNPETSKCPGSLEMCCRHPDWFGIPLADKIKIQKPPANDLINENFCNDPDVITPKEEELECSYYSSEGYQCVDVLNCEDDSLEINIAEVLDLNKSLKCPTDDDGYDQVCCKNVKYDDDDVPGSKDSDDTSDKDSDSDKSDTLVIVEKDCSDYYTSDGYSCVTESYCLEIVTSKETIESSGKVIREKLNCANDDPHNGDVEICCKNVKDVIDEDDDDIIDEVVMHSGSSGSGSKSQVRVIFIRFLSCSGNICWVFGFLKLT